MAPTTKHSDLLQDWHGPAFDVAEPRAPTRYIVMATTARCGSTMLGTSLIATGMLGVPLEYANPTHRPAWEKRTGLRDLRAILEAVKPLRTTPNGVFAIKVHWRHVRWLGGFQGLLSAFPDATFVHLVRDDVLAQAVSFVKAMQTWEWVGDVPGSGRESRFDADRIDGSLTDILLDNNEWRYAFACHGIRPVSLSYERVRADLHGAIRRIAAAADVELPDAVLPAAPPIRAQATAQNDDWARQFVAEKTYSRLLGPSGLRHVVRRKGQSFLKGRLARGWTRGPRPT